jgi:hypothetical protein
MHEMRCKHCGKPLGVYEPVRVAVPGQAEPRVTSVAAEPDAVAGADAAWHLDCPAHE